MSQDQTWRGLRALRADPPGLATDPDRRKVFSASLEQAEQLFHAAEALGPAARPIDLFYGLSQSGRALMAAAEPAPDKWRLTGHGIRAIGGNLDHDLTDIPIANSKEIKGSPSFTSIARILKSPGLPDAVSLGRLLAALPETWDGSDPWLPEATALRVTTVAKGVPGAVFVMSPEVEAWTEGWPVEVAAPGMFPDQAAKAIWVRDHLSQHYPDLADAQITEPVGVRWHAGSYWVRLKWTLPESLGSDELRAKQLFSKTRYYRGHQYVFPQMPGTDRAPHPLTLWWAVTWALSMVARYQPDRWTATLDVDTSKDAVRLEALLDEALDAIPELILDVIRATSALRAPGRPTT